MGRLKESINELDTILENVKGHFLYSDELNGRILGMLNEESLLHSDKLEPNCNHKVTLRELQEAWKYALLHFEGKFDKMFINEIASKIHPSALRYRDISTHIQGPKKIHMMTNPAKIEREMNKLFDYFKESERHPVLKAIEFNMYFLFIHPFEDGNGRTARLLQNLYLNYNNIPPAIIPHRERLTYLRHIEDAMLSFKERQGDQDMFNRRSYNETRFFEYIVDKVKNSAERLSEKIASQKKYNIELEMRGDKGGVYSLKHVLQNSLQASGIPSKIEVYPTKSLFIITSAASEEFLKGIIETYKSKKTFLSSYKITPLF